jgi:O-antigen/teichoic acid export membrane protein
VATLNTAVLGLILIEAGWPTLLYRESAAADNDAAHAVRLAGHAIAAMTCVTLALVLLAAAVPTRLPLALPAALLCMGLVALMNLVSARMRGAGLFAREALWQSSGRVVSAALIVACVLWIGKAPALIFLAWAVGLAVVLALWGGRWLVRPRLGGIRGSLALALPFLLYEGLTVFLTKGDMAVIGAAHLPEPQLSWYAACSRLTEAALLFFAPVTNVLLRHLRMAGDDVPRFSALTRGAIGGAFALGLVALGASLAFGGWAMPWLFGTAYSPAGALLPWIAAMLPFALSNLVLFQCLLARGRERTLAALQGAAAVVLLLALIGGAWTDGARGAAIAVLAVQAVLFLACLFTVRGRHAHRR